MESAIKRSVCTLCREPCVVLLPVVVGWYDIEQTTIYLFMPHVDKITSLLTVLHGEVNFKIHSPDNEKITKTDWMKRYFHVIVPWPIEMSKMWCRKRLSKMSKLVLPFPYLQLKQPAETMRQKSHNRRVRQLNSIWQILSKCCQSEL